MIGGDLHGPQAFGGGVCGGRREAAVGGRVGVKACELVKGGWGRMGHACVERVCVRACVRAWCGV
jgi:hypothetical protein